TPRFGRGDLRKPPATPHFGRGSLRKPTPTAHFGRGSLRNAVSVADLGRRELLEAVSVTDSSRRDLPEAPPSPVSLWSRELAQPRPTTSRTASSTFASSSSKSLSAMFNGGVT